MNSILPNHRTGRYLIRIVAACLALLLMSAVVFAASGRTRISVLPKAPSLVADLKYSTQNGDNYIESEKPGQIKLVVKNKGPGDAYDVKVTLKLDSKIKGLSFPEEVQLGDIPAGKSVTQNIELTGAESVVTAKAKLSVEITNDSGFGEPDPWKIDVVTRAFSVPKLVVVGYEAFDDNNMKKLKPGTTYTLKAVVQNQGQGVARNVVAEFDAQQNVMFVDGEILQQLGDLKPGATKSVEIKFAANKKIKANEAIPISLSLNEERNRYGIREELTRLVMNSSATSSYKEIKQDPKVELEAAPVVAAAEFGTDIVDTSTPKGAKLAARTKGDLAVIIGIKNYEKSPAVDYALNDLERVYDYLLAMGFQKENIIKKPDADQMTFTQMFGTEARTGRLHNLVEASRVDGEPPNVFIYYVGHGVADKNSQTTYFVAKDSDPNDISLTGYGVQTFYANLGKLRANRVMVVLDACYSGQTAKKEALVSGVSPGQLKVKDAAPPTNLAVFTSSSGDQVSTWYEEKSHSLFTYYFLKGLLGESDMNKDNDVTYRELEDYVRNNVKRTALRKDVIQEPSLAWNKKNEKVVVFTPPPPPPAKGIGDSSLNPLNLIKKAF